MKIPHAIGVLALLACAPVAVSDTTIPGRAVREGRVLKLDWEGLRSATADGNFRRRIVVQDGTRLVKGELIQVSEGVMEIETSERREFIKRNGLRWIRLIPAKGHKRKWRQLAVIGAVPMGLGAYMLSFAPWGGLPEGGEWSVASFALFPAVAVPYVVYRLARRADRKRGALYFVVDEENGLN